MGFESNLCHYSIDGAKELSAVHQYFTLFALKSVFKLIALYLAFGKRKSSAFTPTLFTSYQTTFL